MPAVTVRSSHESYIEPESGGEVDITQAEFMLSIGRGISEEDNVEQFAELADSMEFTLGCSRPIADNGWLPKYRQVGQSGRQSVVVRFMWHSVFRVRYSIWLA